MNGKVLWHGPIRNQTSMSKFVLCRTISRPAAHAGVVEAADKALRRLQQHFFPELVRNTELFTELFERSARPALIRVRRHVLPTFIRKYSDQDVPCRIAWHVNKWSAVNEQRTTSAASSPPQTV